MAKLQFAASKDQNATLLRAGFVKIRASEMTLPPRDAMPVAMSDYLLKQALFTLEPIGFVWLCLGLLSICLWWKRHRRLAIWASALVVFITIVGSTPVPDWLLESLERPYATFPAADQLPTADAVVLLGGGSEPARREFCELHLSPAGDRLVMARALMRLGKAPVLVLGGGGMRIDGRWESEAEHVRDLFVTWDIPASAMIPLPYNADTHDEAVHTRAVAEARGWKRILLVTSANHMRRASAVFRKQGLDVIPVPCNFLTSLSTSPGPYPICVPRYDGFVKMATWLHEMAGWRMYRRRGWVDAQ